MRLLKAQVVYVTSPGTALRARFRVDPTVIKRLEKTAPKTKILTKSYFYEKIKKITFFRRTHYLLPNLYKIWSTFISDAVESEWMSLTANTRRLHDFQAVGKIRSTKYFVKKELFCWQTKLSGEIVLKNSAEKGAEKSDAQFSRELISLFEKIFFATVFKKILPEVQTTISARYLVTGAVFKGLVSAETPPARKMWSSWQ